MQYKALILDLDGTTIPHHSDGLPTKRVKEALFAASEKLYVGIATARALFLVEPLLSHLPFNGPSVISGGAQIIELPSKQLLTEHIIPFEDFLFISETLAQKKLHFSIQDNNQEKEFNHEYVPEKPFYILIYPIVAHLADALITQFSALSTVIGQKIPSTEPEKVWLIFSHAAATKQHGIYEVAKILGISTQEIIGVGDGYNDVPLLMACGLKVAMGNAVDELKAIADVIAPSVTDDGVASIIQHYILQPK